MAASVEQRVKEIICEQLGVSEDQVTQQASFIEDLGADSLDIVELVMALEEESSQDTTLPSPQASLQPLPAQPRYSNLNFDWPAR